MALRAAVIIPTHNRIELLAKTIDSVLAQTVQSEIYVMDDACTDGTEAMVRSKYPGVLFHREEKSRGPTFQRNKAAAMTGADILFTIDDDCIVSSPNTFAQTLEAFDHSRIGAVTIPFINVLQDQKLHSAAPDRVSVVATHDYFGGMVAIRRNIFHHVGGYRSFLFIQVEEPDLTIRLLQAGYIVRLGWADPIQHMESPLRNRPGRHRQGPAQLRTLFVLQCAVAGFSNPLGWDNPALLATRVSHPSPDAGY